MRPVFALAALTCAMLAACTGVSTSSTNRAAASSPSPSPASSPHVTGPLSSPGHPLVLSCAAEAWPGYPDRPAPITPGPRDLAIGPMYFAGGLALATETPAQHGYAPFGRHGRFYKFGLVVRPSATVTVTIGASARGHAVIALAWNGLDLGDLPCLPSGGRLLRPGLRLYRPAVPRLRAAPGDGRRSGPGPSRHAVAVRGVLCRLTHPVTDRAGQAAVPDTCPIRRATAGSHGHGRTVR